MDKQQFSISANVQSQTLELWLEQRWLLPAHGASGPTFAEGDIARARLIQDLKADFSVNDEGIDLILHLLDQLHGLRAALAELREPLSPGR